MVNVDLKVASLPNNPPLAQSKESEPDAISLFNERLDYLRLPNKGINLLLGWGELLPLNKGILGHLASQRMTTKTVKTVLGVPNFFTKPIKLYQACQERKSNDVKKIFYAFVGVVISTLKMPLLLHKTRIIDLKRISGYLPDELKRGAAILTLGVACVRLADNSMAFAHQWEKSQSSGYAGFQEVIHTKKGKKLGMKLISSTVKTGLAFMGAASLFFGCQLPPLVLITASTLSFTATLTNKMLFSKAAGKKGKMQSHEDSVPLKPEQKLPQAQIQSLMHSAV